MKLTPWYYKYLATPKQKCALVLLNDDADEVGRFYTNALQSSFFSNGRAERRFKKAQPEFYKSLEAGKIYITLTNDKMVIFHNA